MSKKMSPKESSSVVPAGPQSLFTKFKSKAKDAESPKSVISDPRIVSPSSSASASLERRLTDLKKVPRHDRVHSISDAEEENALPGVNLSAVLLSRQLSAKASNGHLLLEPVSEVLSASAVHPRLGHISGPGSETSSPRVRMSRNTGKDGAKVGRGSDNEFTNRRISLPGADSTTSSAFALPHPTDLEGGYTQSFTCSPPKSRNHDESDRIWRNAAGFRDPRPIPSQTLASEYVQGTRLAREDRFQMANLKSERKIADVDPMCNVLMTRFNGLTSDETVSGRGTSTRSDEPISRESSTVKNDSELPYEDQIELNKFVVRGSGGEEIRTGEHKIAWSPGSSREHRNSFSGDGRSSLSGFRHSKTSKKIFSPGESPGHPNGFNESPRSTLFELSSDFVMKATAQGGKDFPEMQIVQKDTRTYTLKSTSHSDCFDKNSSARLVDGWKKAGDYQIGSGVAANMQSADLPSSLHAHTGMAGANVPDGPNAERTFQYGGKVSGGETTRTNLMPQQRFVPGQFLKSNPLKPRPPPAKWDDAEKWLVNPASVKSNAHSSLGNGPLSGGSTPHHTSQFHAATSVRHHNSTSSNQSSRIFGTSCDSLPVNGESFGARLLPDSCDGSSNISLPTNVVHFPRSYDSSTTTDSHEECLPVDAKVCEISNRDDTGTRPEDKFADSITVQSVSPSTGRLIIVMKDAATEITPSTSQRDIATQVTPAPSFHAAVTPPRIHNGGPARLNTTPVHSERRPASVGVDVTELKNCHQAKLELDQAATLDTHWTTREEEVEESAKSLRLSVSRSVDFKEVKRNVLEARAAAWEEAEQSKYMARYHREEAKILAWEAHEKAKAEADMRKVEVKLERMRSHANELLQNKLASVHLKAENMRAGAAAKCGEQAAKTNHWAQEIRYHGRSPSPRGLCCLPRFKSSYPQCT